MTLFEKAKKVLDILRKKYPNAKTALNFKTPLELLIATILSAQCTDERVNKTKNIHACCKKIVDEFGGKVPDTLEQLVTLPGVGRKTANIVLGYAFGKDAIAVDTHVKRVSNRIGLAAYDNPDKIEEDLCEIIPQKRWTKATNLLIMHGRNTCVAKRPKCGICGVKKYCDYFNNLANT